MDACYGLEGYAYNMRNSIEDEEKLGGKLAEKDKEAIEEAINEVIEWLYDNTEATKEEYDAKLNESHLQPHRFGDLSSLGYGRKFEG